MTYAQFHESGPGSGLGGTFAARNPYLVVLIDFSQNASERPNGPEGRPARLGGKFGQLFNKVIHMRCG
ncbi:hypothetical protein E2P84_12985 [Burkholderia cepacia]|uniref:Uncharacterized protein n=1 Tax=Burkholderia cepacia TaxID=292 RepID=A0AAX2RKJ8_BURCE|nr:hypothetical protein E2P84_12985 [Burkholderia cepacia]TET01049.1 hypothetical protein E3D36_19435 [Burkholderia cepacia]TEU31079.1 hypothetical protein E3D39_39925 [Burkholderia cepacia]TEU34745.1 hypothetical protein E3D38_43005 [Burkholderia cepacia]TEU44996.1 hypothetical protein E3D37_20745 [Burkholderia cepacia]